MGASAIITLLAPMFTDLIGRLFPDPQKKAEAEQKMQELLIQAQTEANKAEAGLQENKKEIITAEIKSSWAGNWRAYLMLVCVSILGYNWVLVSFLNAFLVPLGCPITAVPVPTELWTLVTVGLGGYIGKETMDNYSQGKIEKARIENTVNDKAFYDTIIKELYPKGITQAQVNIFNRALDARDGK